MPNYTITLSEEARAALLRRLTAEGPASVAEEIAMDALAAGADERLTVPRVAAEEVLRVIQRSIVSQLELAQSALRHVARTATAEAETMAGGHYQLTDFVAGEAAKYAEALAVIRGLQEAQSGVAWLLSDEAQTFAPGVCAACRAGHHRDHEDPCSCRHAMHRAAR